MAFFLSSYYWFSRIGLWGSHCVWSSVIRLEGQQSTVHSLRKLCMAWYAFMSSCHFFLESLLYIGHCPWGITCIIFFNPHKTPVRQVTSLPLYRWGSWSSQALNNLFKVYQLPRRKLGFKPMLVSTFLTYIPWPLCDRVWEDFYREERDRMMACEGQFDDMCVGRTGAVTFSSSYSNHTSSRMTKPFLTQGSSWTPL
jgi:hypothetical protein